MSDRVEKSGGRWWKILLGLSLALNLLFIGALVGGRFMHSHHGSFRGPPDFMLKRWLGHLPEDKQTHVLGELKSYREKLRPEIRSVRQLSGQLKKQVAATPFDHDNIRRAAEQLLAKRQQIGRARTEFVIRVLEPLSEAERQKLLENHFFRRLLRLNRKHWRRWRGHEG